MSQTITVMPTQYTVAVNADGYDIVSAAVQGPAGGGSGGGSGTVTSVALSAPALFDVAGSPVSTAGTLVLSFAAQAAKTFLAGPTSGANAAPTMRAIQAADLPANVALLDATGQTFTRALTFGDTITFSTGLVIGGMSLANNNIITGVNPLTITTSNVVRLDDGFFSLRIVLNPVSGQISATSFAGGGAALTSLNASNLASGTVPDARLSANVPLLVGGVLPTSTLPALAITEFLGTVASQAAMLALTGQRGDWCIRSDDSHVYILTTDDPTQAADWQAISYPTAPVTAVNGHTGNVTLGPSDVGAQPADAELSAIAGLTSAADTLPYFTGSGTAALTAFTSIARTLLASADAATVRTALGLGSLAIKSTVTLTTDVTGVLPAGNLPTTVVYGDVADIPHRVGWVLARGTPATTGTNKAGVKVRLPYAGTFKKVWADAETGPTGADLIIDIKLNGTSLWSVTTTNRPKIAAGSTSGTQTSFDTVNFAAGDYLTIDIAQVGSTVAGQDIAVGLDMQTKNQ